MNLIRAAIDNAVADVIAEHPKYFTPAGQAHARKALVREIMSAFRGDGDDKAAPAAPEAPAQAILADPGSREGIAYLMLRQVGGAVAPFRTAGGQLSVPANCQGQDVMAFADTPPRADWVLVSDRRGIAAWNEFLADKLANVPRRAIAITRDGETGIEVPWLWPPAKTGKTYDPEEEA